MMDTTPTPRLRGNYFGRRIGRPLKDCHEQLLEHAYPLYALPSADHALDLARLFPTCTTFVLEIGYGTGAHLLAQVQHAPTTGFIGCEPYVSGVTQLLKCLPSQPPLLDNLCLTMAPIQDVLSLLPDESLSKIYILFPDPWPKARHHKRRLVGPEFLPLFAQKLDPQGRMIIATDHAEYALFMQAAFARVPSVELLTTEALTPTHLGNSPRPSAWPITRFEGKAHKEGRPCQVFTLRRSLSLAS